MRGIPIWNSDTIRIDVEGGTEELQWTLSRYIKISNIKYPSKARFYCVRRGLFAYRKEASFITNLSQKAALSQCGDKDVEYLYRDEESEGPMLYPQNPCAFHNMFFTGIEIWSDNKKIDLVEKNCKDSGKVVYKGPQEEAVFGIWTGGLTYPKCHVALLAAVVTGGFHRLSTYSWKSKERYLTEETDPIMYAKCRGEFTCEVSTTVDGEEKKVALTFCVSGSVDDWRVDVPDCVGTPCLIEDVSDEMQSDSSQPVISDGPESRVGDVTAPVVSSEGVSILERAIQELSLLSLGEPQKLLLLNAIGSGAFGTVYRACWRGMLVAAKVIPTQCKVTTKEVEVLRLIQHPHLSTLLGIVRLEGDKIAVITPLVRGSNLHVIFGDNHRKVSEKEKLLLCIQVCQAMVFLHTNTPVMAHLDIKPANILIDLLAVHATLTDFGLAKVMTNTAQVGTRTMLAGTPGFQPAEQLRAQYVGIECDVYAFGGVLLVVFTERPLWEGLAPFQIMYKVTIENTAPDTSGLHSSLETLCKQCFQDRESRPSSAQVLNALLHADLP